MSATVGPGPGALKLALNDADGVDKDSDDLNQVGSSSVLASGALPRLPDGFILGAPIASSHTYTYGDAGSVVANLDSIAAKDAPPQNGSESSYATIVSAQSSSLPSIAGANHPEDAGKDTEAGPSGHSHSLSRRSRTGRSPQLPKRTSSLISDPRHAGPGPKEGTVDRPRNDGITKAESGDIPGLEDEKDILLDTLGEKAAAGTHFRGVPHDPQGVHAADADNALLNLPPPMPFDLKVDKLWVGVPHKVATKWVHDTKRTRGKWIPKAFRGKTEKGEEAEEGVPRRKWILKGAECDCKSGEVLAILGGSGSGKTTLLNQIAYRGTGLPVEDGEVAYHASQAQQRTSGTLTEGVRAGKATKREMGRRIGFVRQQDFLVEHLTVHETLTYAARLRLPPDLSRKTIAQIVEQVIDELGLRDAADTVVGGPLRKGISGGEKRRLSIGCVMVTLPSVLILDEPTSGLDAFTSYLLLLTLSQLARRGRTVILSIHAPRSDAFEIFDRIALLSKGEMVYSGPRHGCLEWFRPLGHALEVGVNPLDFLIDISSIDNRTAENEEISRSRVKHLVDAWKARSDDDRQFQLQMSNTEKSEKDTSIDLCSDHASLHGDLQRAITGTSSVVVDHIARDERRPGFFRQTNVLIARAHRNVYRNFAQLAGLIAQGAILGVIIGATYYRLPEDPTGVQSLKNLSFQLVPGVFYLQQVFWIYKFCTDLVIFDREREDHLYDVVPYIISDWMSFLLPSVAAPTIYLVVLYFMTRLRPDDLAANLFTLVADVILVQFCTQGCAMLAASVTRSFAAASVIGNALNLFQIMSSGFIVVNVPPYVWWIRWISPYFYSFRITATTQFRNRTFDCPPDSLANLAQCDGNNVLASFGIDPSTNIGVWFSGLFGVAIAEYALVCIVLRLWNGGGVKHASEIESNHRGKTADVMESHMTREKIDVEASCTALRRIVVRNLSFRWEKRAVPGISKPRSKVILDDVSMSFPAGQVSAILGPSGAGKSTLLQLLASRKLGTSSLARFTSSGHVFHASRLATTASQSHFAFVEQDDDWHLPRLTVRETLRYAAILRLPDKMPRRQKIARAETVLLMLGLKDCADLPVGGAVLKGISGGEKRRLSLAVQMINDPAVLLVDEPTSGLDASIALSVMQVLRDIAATGRTVIATIHQPRSDVWRLVDNVTLLAKGGRVTFSGKREHAVDFFHAAGYPMPSAYFNPADHLLDLVSVDTRKGNHADSQQRVEGLISKWRQHQNKVDVDEERPGSADLGGVHKKGDIAREKKSTGMIVALPVVLERHWKNLWRQKEVFSNRIIQPPLLACLFLLFFQRLSNGPSGAQDRIGLTIENTTALSFVGLLNAIAIFPADRNLYLHESKSSARYSPATFVLVYTLVEVGFELIAALAYGALAKMNVAVGMQTSARIYFQFSISIWALVNMGESLTMIAGAFISIEGLTVTVVSTALSIIGQFSGVISLSVPAWLAALAWGFTLKPTTRIHIINESIGLVFRCSTEEIQSGACVAQTGEQMLALFDWRDLNVDKFTGIAVAVAVAWRLIAWLAMCARVGGFR